MTNLMISTIINIIYLFFFL